MLAALLYSASGFALFSVGALGLMATVAFTSIFFAVMGGEFPRPYLYSIVLLLLLLLHSGAHGCVMLQASYLQPLWGWWPPHFLLPALDW